jgi:hypothetical protein
MKLRLAFACGAVLLALASSAGAAIAIVPGTGANGTLAAGSTVANQATLVIATTADCPAGSLLVVHGMISTPRTLSTVADAAGNTYSGTNSYTNGPGGGAAALFYSLTTADLPSGSNITLTFSFASTAAKLGEAACFSGIQSSPLDNNGSGNDNGGVVSTTAVYPASGGLTTAQASELVISLAQYNAGGGTIASYGSGYTGLALVQNGVSLTMAYQVLTSVTTSLSATTTFSANQHWGANIVTFKGVSGAKQLLLLGVGE